MSNTTANPSYASTLPIASGIIAAWVILSSGFVMFFFPLITTNRWVTVSGIFVFLLGCGGLAFARRVTNTRIIVWAKNTYGETFTREEIKNFRVGKPVQRGTDYWILNRNNKGFLALIRLSPATSPDGYTTHP